MKQQEVSNVLLKSHAAGSPVSPQCYVKETRSKLLTLCQTLSGLCLVVLRLELQQGKIVEFEHSLCCVRMCVQWMQGSLNSITVDWLKWREPYHLCRLIPQSV